MPRDDLIQLRGDTTTNWAEENPVLEDREPGLDTDLGLVKYGDGVTEWLDLPFAAGADGLAAHVVDETPHPAYDVDLPSLTLIYENHLI